MSDSASAAQGSMLVMMLIVWLVIYLIVAFPLYRIAQTLGSDMAWLAFVPIANAVLLLNLGDFSGWLILLGLIPIIGGLIVGIIAIIAWMNICGKLGKERLLGLLMIVPLVNFIFLYYLAFSAPGQKSSY